MKITKEEQQKYLNMPIVKVIKELNEKKLDEDSILEIFVYLIQTK